MLCALTASFRLVPSVLAQNASLEFAEKPLMINCELANAPCFRLTFNIVDGKGAPAPMALPPADQLADNFAIHVGERSAAPFYVSIGGGGHERNVRPRLAMILIDVSGSMNKVLKTGQTRFDAATEAVSIFLNGFEDGIDRVAIAPFGSRQVVETLRSASFASAREAAMRTLHDIPRPDPKANTGLFSAVSTALDILTAASHDFPGSPETMLIVMTDGENDVRNGDDPGLLTGSEGLDRVARKVQDAGIPVNAIGFGDRREIDTNALQRIGSKYDVTEDPDALKRIFSVARALLNSRIRVTVESPWTDRASLAGRSFLFNASLRLPSGQTINSNDVTWATPQMGLPTYQGRCEEAESKALLARNKLQQSYAWMGIAFVRPVLVFVGLGAVLLILWFGVPRLVWPDRYEKEASPLRPERWVDQTRASGQSAYRKKAPPGFDKRSGGPDARAAGDKTIVRARDPYTTRTRFD